MTKSEEEVVHLSRGAFLVLCDSLWRTSRNDAIRIIGEEMANCSKVTGHGKAQRAFAHAVLRKLAST